MADKEYLLDTNVVIKIWNEYPNLFQAMELHDKIDFKIHHNIAAELYIKECLELDGIPVLTDRFIKLIGHVISEDADQFSKVYRPNISVKYNEDKQTYYINGNKLSRNDYNLICICEKHKQYTLVTEDKKTLNSARIILNSCQILDFNEFLWDLKKFGILNRKS